MPLIVYADGSATCEKCFTSYPTEADLDRAKEQKARDAEIVANAPKRQPPSVDVDELTKRPPSELTDLELAAVKQRQAEEMHFRNQREKTG